MAVAGAVEEEAVEGAGAGEEEGSREKVLLSVIAEYKVRAVAPAGVCVQTDVTCTRASGSFRLPPLSYFELAASAVD